MKMTKKKWIWLVVIIIAIIAIFFGLSGKEEVTYTTEKAQISDLEQTVEVTGSIEAADDIDLNFNSAGTLQAVLVEAGDEVKVGQTLARLVAGDVSSQVADARAAVVMAQSELDLLLAGASDQDIEVTEQELASAQSAYDTALDTLSNLEKTRDQELANLKEEALNALDDKTFVAQYTLDIVYDAILDGSAKDSLWVSDLILLSQAKDNYQTSLNDLDVAEELLATAKATRDFDDIVLAADKMEETLEVVLTTVSQTFDLMSVTVENSVYTSAVISAFKSSLSTQSTALGTAIAAIQSDSSSLRSQNLYYQTQIIDAENSIASKLASLKLAEAKLDLKLAPPRDFEVDVARAQVDRAKATLSRYLSNLSDTIIKAPVDGIITKVNFDTGEQSSMSKPVISMIGLSNMQIEVDVPESDIVKLEVGDQVEIDLDAFSSDEEFMGTVTFIDPASTDIDGVVYYRVKVSLNGDDKRIKSGMTADLTISTESREQVLTVPSRAVIYREDGKYIQLLENGKLVEREISTGLRGDGGMVEILSGIEEGAEVITFIKNGD